MSLPFSHDAFLDVFDAYNTALWPAVALLWIVTFGMAVGWLRQGSVKGGGVFALLAVHWAWSGIVYHWLFFRLINPAATLFGALFVLQAALFLWLAVTSRAQFDLISGPRALIGGALVLYGLVYPLLGFGLGLDYPRVPLFGVPCPTTLITAGLLLTASGVPRGVNIVPIIWAGVGGSAAALLGMWADIALVVAGLLLALDTFRPPALGALRNVST